MALENGDKKYDRAKDGIKAINDFAFIEKKLKRI